MAEDADLGGGMFPYDVFGSRVDTDFRRQLPHLSAT